MLFFFKLYTFGYSYNIYFITYYLFTNYLDIELRRQLKNDAGESFSCHKGIFPFDFCLLIFGTFFATLLFLSSL